MTLNTCVSFLTVKLYNLYAKGKISKGQWTSLTRLPCVEGYQGGNKVKWPDDVELGACEAKEKLAQANSYLKNWSQWDVTLDLMRY